MAEGNLFSPVDEGSSSARQGTDRAAHNQRGQNEGAKTGFEPNSARIPQIDANAADAMQRRRASMLQRFTAAALSALRPAFSFYGRGSGRRGKGKAKGKATTGGRAFQLRKAQKRGRKRSAFLAHLARTVRPKNPTPRSPARRPGWKLPPTAQP